MIKFTPNFFLTDWSSCWRRGRNPKEGEDLSKDITGKSLKKDTGLSKIFLFDFLDDKLQLTSRPVY